MKRFAINREIDAEQAMIKAMKNWIKVVKEVLKNQRNFSRII